jgi:MFS family permease
MGNELRFGPSHRWRVLGIGVAANAAVATALGGLPAAAVLMRLGYHLSVAEFGGVLGAMGLGLALSELPWGLVTDRLGDRRVLLMGLGLTSVVLAIMAVFDTPASGPPPTAIMLGLGLFCMGLVGGSVNGSSGRAVMAWFRDGERGFAMSIRQVSVPTGGALGALILPSTAQHSGFDAVFALLSLSCLVIAAFTWAWLHEPPTKPVEAVQAGRGESAATSALANRQLWRAACGLGALCVPQVLAVTFSAVFLHDVVHLSTGPISGSIAAFQVGAIFTRIWSGRFTDRHKNRRAFLKVCALVTATLFATLGLSVGWASFSPNHAAALSLAIALLIVGAAAASTWHGVAYTELATIAGMAHVGTALGLGNSFAFGIYFVAPLVAPFILHILAWPGVWFTAATSALLAFALFPRPDGRVQ